MYSTRIRSTKQVSLSFAEHPGKKFSARLLKTAGAIDTSTMTLQAEFAVDNKQDILLPGSYTMVEFSIPNTPDSVILPANTLIFRAKGLQVAVVEKDRRVSLKKIEIGTDFGKKVQVNSVIKPGEQIVINPPDSLYNGEHVEVVNEKHPINSSGERKSLA
jgi:multidrug efflux pump subunit AcrA (membrane-fusion protein)